MLTARVRSAGLVGAAVAVFFLSLTSPAAASPLVDETATWNCLGWQIETDNSSVAPPIGCFSYFSFFGDASAAASGAQAWLTDLALLDLDGLAETLLNVYVGDPLEEIPFFGSGLADLAIALILVPVRIAEPLIDLFVAVTGPVIDSFAYGFLALNFAFSWLQGFGWWIANTLFFAFADLASTITGGFSGLATDVGLAVSGVVSAITGFFSDLPSNILGVFVDPADAAYLFTNMGELRDKLWNFIGEFSDIFSALEIVDASDTPGVAMPGGVSVNVLAVFDTMPPALGIAVQAFVGFWLVFGIVQALGSIGRMTDAS